MTPPPAAGSSKASSGIAGLDEILGGGFPRGYTYLIQGAAGVGKTTLGLQFALAGLQAGETVLYVTLSETEHELEEIAASHGWSLTGLHLHDPRPADPTGRPDVEQTIFHTADIELDEMTTGLLEIIRTNRPERLVFDSVTEIFLLAETPLRYRRQLMILRQVLIDVECTALFINNEILTADRSTQSLLHGTIELDRTPLEYGAERRRLRVIKMRGMLYQRGYQDYQIVSGGLVVYPRLTPPEGDQAATWTPMSSGVDQLDALVGGGLHTGTTCLLAGQTGTGKSSLAVQYLTAAARRGQAGAAIVFDESLETFRRRAAGIGLALDRFEADGLVTLRQFDLGQFSPGQLGQAVRHFVEQKQVKLVIIDGLSGYFKVTLRPQLLPVHMQDLLTYLSRHDILTLLTVTYHGVVENITWRDVDLSYLTDTVILLRHFEARGSVHQAISVIKKRYGPHEKTIRQLQITGQGVCVGKPLTAFSGVLSGRPSYEGESGELFNGKTV